jgi:4-carboxymuconolactone decarboxylase
MGKEAPMQELPKTFLEFRRRNPAVAGAYEDLGRACAGAGPLDARTRELVKLGMAIGGGLEGAVHSHVRRALEAGATPKQIRHVVALAVPTIGFPATAAAFTWVEDLLGGGPPAPKRSRRS